jgi:SWI/SNF-related matrix-associated actin-dependent regulator 1 of chromatin subfamily A
LKYISAETLIDSESLPFYKRLFEFQKECLSFGIKHHGRLLLADEMGVGKTIQSLAVAYIYRYEWPLLIICPPTLKFNWQNEVKRWYPDIQPHQIQLINNKKTALKVSVQIMIVSYDLAWRMKDMFDNVRVVIVDEAHYLKGQDSKRSQVLVPFLSTRKRVVLLTGTPAFARPK